MVPVFGWRAEGDLDTLTGLRGAQSPLSSATAHLSGLLGCLNRLGRKFLVCAAGIHHVPLGGGPSRHRITERTRCGQDTNAMRSMETNMETSGPKVIHQALGFKIHVLRLRYRRPPTGPLTGLNVD